MSNSNNDFFAIGAELIKKIEAHQFEAYFVGGCVRDFLLQKQITDIDIATSATPDELQEIFPHLIPIGIDHGTVLVREQSMSFEITTFRTDQQLASIEKVASSLTLQEDVKRRDFTINALAMDRHFHLIDYIHGQQDIENRLIRGVGDPVQRIQEDPLRILRGLRFVSQFLFTIEQSTAQAMKDNVQRLQTVAIERLATECGQIFTNSGVQKALEQFLYIRADRYLPIFSEEPNLIPSIIHTIQPLQSFSEIIAIMHIRAPHHTVNDWVNEWKCSKTTQKHAHTLVRAYKQMIMYGRIDPYIVYALSGHVESFVRICEVIGKTEYIDIDTLRMYENSLSITHRSDLAINGKDVLQLYPAQQPGKWINNILQKLEYMVVMGEIPNDKKTLKEWMICNPPDFN